MRTCAHCGVKHDRLRATYCSHTCRVKAAQKRVTDVCSMDGCSARRRTKGLCSTHYNQQSASRRRTALVQVACTTCGKVVTKWRSKRMPFCDLICRDLWRLEHPHPADLDPSLKRPALRPRRKQGYQKHAAAVFERDGWTCWLCGQPIPQDARVPDPRAATLDHLVPRSRGGDDDPANLGAAHFVCNVRRGASDQLTLPGPMGG